MKAPFTFLLLLLITALSSCNENSDSIDLDPTNVSVAVTVADDGSGIVEIVATGENVVKYEFIVGESGGNTVVNTTGIYSHTYSLTGIYLIEVKAFGSSERFVKKTKEITVTVGEDIGPIDGDNGYITPLSYEGMNLIWQDEFNGSSLNETEWNFEVNGDGGGNNELQYYRRENTSLSDGFLTIEAKKETYLGKSYTSSRLTTQHKFSFQYGRVDIRAILPKGQGLWPALWMLGDNISTVGWPKCGEVDIMEMIGGGAGRDDTTHGTLHWDNSGSYACTCGQNEGYTLTDGVFADKFHVFSIEWNQTTIKWYLDDVLFNTVDITGAELSEFHDTYFLIFNVAVGGNWPGSPNSSTVFPQTMVVDYVRVFQ